MPKMKGHLTVIGNLQCGVRLVLQPFQHPALDCGSAGGATLVAKDALFCNLATHDI
jgi:hypothetical protein